MEDSSFTPGKFLKPDAIITQLNVAKGGVAADFGCGPGYFSLPFAKAVGEDGRVYSLDVLAQSLETVASEARVLGISNIETKRVNLENSNGSKLESAKLDWVIMKDVLFQNKKKDKMIEEAYRILKDGGQVLVVEWAQNDLTVGPEKEIRILPEDLKKMFQDQKFTIEKDIDAGDFHYAFVAVK
jgi:ubiquinone/menaquinone biosynthesis C-methylase UbiE